MVKVKTVLESSCVQQKCDLIRIAERSVVVVLDSRLRWSKVLMSIKLDNGPQL
jgi:hypothetical protein